MAVELGDHQTEALEKMHNGSVLKGGVGTGKSRTALAYFYVKECKGELKLTAFGTWRPPANPKDLFIITTAKKRDSLDWLQELSHFGLSNDPESSFGIEIQIDSWNNIQNYENVKNAFFIFDEQRLVGSGAWVKAFIKIAKQNRWILLSATPGDTWMDYIPVFVANGFYPNRTAFVREHVVWNTFTKFPKIDRYVEEKKLERLRKQILVEMPYTRHTKRHIVNTMVTYDKTLYDRVKNDRWHVYEDRPIKDAQEWGSVLRKVVNSDTSRLAAILELLEWHERLIIFYNFNYELETLRSLKNVLDIPIAEWNGHKHEPLPNTEKWVYLVQYAAGAEGWNCVSTDAIAFYSLNHSWKVWEQAKGRIDRLNTPYTDLYYYVLRSMSWTDTQIAKCLATKRDFNIIDYTKGLFKKEKESDEL